MNTITGIGVLPRIAPVPGSPADIQSTQKDEGISFADMLNQEISKVNQLQVDSQEVTDLFAAGKTDNIHEVMIAAEKADIAMQLTLQIRTKILDAYNEIMRMQI